MRYVNSVSPDISSSCHHVVWARWLVFCRTTLTALLFVSVFFSQPIFAQQDGQQADQDAEEEKSPLVYKINENIEIGFEAEVEEKLAKERDFDDIEQRAISTTVTGGPRLLIYDWIFAKGIFEFASEQISNETDQISLIVDKAFVRIGNKSAVPLFWKGGYYTSPFGNFDSMHIEDPLTASAFEVKGEGVEMFYDGGESFLAQVFAFRGTRDLTIRQFRGEKSEKQHQKWRLGAGLSHTMIFSDDIKLTTEFYITNSIYSAGDLINLVPFRSGRLGGSAKVGIDLNGYSASAQYVTAFEKVTFVDEDESSTSKPAALAVELAATHEFENFTGFLATGYSRTWGLMNIEPEHQVLLTAGIEKEALEISFEYGHQWDYVAEEARKRAHFVVAQITYSW